VEVTHRYPAHAIFSKRFFVGVTPSFNPQAKMVNVTGEIEDGGDGGYLMMGI
jgi:hypothetical protein